MNYIGRVLSQNFSGDFLKEALRKADKKMLFRGPEYYKCSLLYAQSLIDFFNKKSYLD